MPGQRQGGRGGGGFTVCPIDGQRYLASLGACPNQSTHGANPVPKYRECMQCHGPALIDGPCRSCEQRRGGQKKPLCPSCKNPLPDGTTQCAYCGWDRNWWKCKGCETWHEPTKRVCARCNEQQRQREDREEAKQKRQDDREEAKEKAQRDRAEQFVSCGTCDLKYKASEGGCPHCTIKCGACSRRYPADKPECPYCTILTEYDLKVVRDEDEVQQRWELTVIPRFKRGSQPWQPMAARVRFHDPGDAADEKDLPMGGGTFHAPYQAKERRVAFTAVSAASPHTAMIGTSQEAVLPGKPVKYTRPPLAAGDNPY